AVVKRKRQLPWRGGLTECRSKKLRAGMDRRVGDDGARKHGSRRKFDQPRIHASDLFRSAQRLQVNSQLLAFFVKMAAFEAQSARHVGHVEIVTANLSEQNFFFEGLGARC